ncbi:MAG TPA: YciI family protein [Rhodothermales bacterium]
MRYTLLLHYPEVTEEEVGREAMEQGMAAFQAYAKALEDAGVLRSAEVLLPSVHATTVSRRNGSLIVHDGPYAETKEQLGGTFVLEVPDRETAVAWAEKCPSVQWGVVEVRPSAVRFVDGEWIEA